MFLAENDLVGLAQYTHSDDRDFFECWRDLQTQKGYNGFFRESFHEFSKHEIDRFKFWVTAVDKGSNAKVGVLRLGLDDVCPDLAIWIYPDYRHRGYGKSAFRLALEYVFSHFNYDEISAGCYDDNIYSRKILEDIGFVRYPKGDGREINCFTGEQIIQREYRVGRACFLGE